MDNLLFDLDGTLANPGEGITRCIQHALQVLGEVVPPRRSLERFIGPPLHHSFKELLADPSEQQVGLAIEAYRERYQHVGITENQNYRGVVDCLNQLCRGGCRLFIATSKPQVFAVQVAERLGLVTLFERIYGSELSGARSDKAELLAHLLARENLRPRQTLMVGDRSHDVRGAHANGVRACGVTWGFGTRTELVSAGADLIVDSAGELLDAVMPK